jgi:membrane associated rhomboid family serine protease
MTIMTKNNLLADLKYKIFRSGNPVFFYIGINTIVFVAVALFGVTYFLAGNTNIRFLDYASEYLAFPAALPKIPFRFYTVLTYQFLHEGILHILFNMLWLFWMGNIFIDFLKPRQFHFVYLAGGIMGAVFFALAYNIFPAFSGNVYAATIIGSSASVMAIAVAVTTLLPDYTISLMFIGSVKLRYVVLVYIVIDLIGIASTNAGGSFAHLGGAFMGFIYIKLLQSGHDWSSIFKKKPKLKVVRNETPKAGSRNNTNKVNQKEVDMILDKISRSGYDKLSKEEKETLFKASKS